MLEKFADYHQLIKTKTSEILIIFVANVREKTTDYLDYDKTSLTSEYLSLTQFELFIETIRSCGFETIGFFDENDFIRDAIANEYYHNYGKTPIVISSAQKGTAVGRKSLVPAFCDINHIWHTNSNAYVVSLARNKFHSDCILDSMGFPSLNDCLYVPKSGWFKGRKPKKNEKVIAKLNGETSSIGLSSENIFIYSSNKDNYISALSERFNQPVIVQRFIEGFEVEVPVVSELHSNQIETVLPVGISLYGEQKLSDKILDYNIRKELSFGFYNYGTANPNVSKTIEELAKDVIRLFGITGFGRVDFRIDFEGDAYITDIATNPHLTEGMSFHYAFLQNGMDMKQMLQTLIAVAYDKYSSYT